MKRGELPPEFARLVSVPQFVGREATYAVAAAAPERAALARRFALLELDRLEADVHLVRLQGGLVRLSATLTAEVVQSCIVSLEPVASRVEERFTLLYGAGTTERDIILDGAAETVEPLEDGRIDIGEAVAQQLSLALDPFPRASGADLETPP